LSEIIAQGYRQNGENGLAGGLADEHALPRLTPLYLALFDRLRTGGDMPVSHVDPGIFDHLAQIDADTPFPPRPAPSAIDFPRFPGELVLARRDALQADGVVDASPIPAFELDAIHEFATTNLLRRTTDPLASPDVTAPLGYFYYVFGTALRRDF